MAVETTFIIFGTFIGFFSFIIIKMLYGIMIDRRWPISVSVGMQRGNSIVWDNKEKGKLMKLKNGYQIVRLRKRKQNIKPPKYERLELNDRGKPMFNIFNTASGQYFFISMKDTPNLEVIVDASDTNWAIQELMRANNDYKTKEGWFAKYGIFVMSSILAATIIFNAIFFNMKMETISSNFNGAAAMIRDGMYVMNGYTPPGQNLQANNNTAPPNSNLNILGMTLP